MTTAPEKRSVVWGYRTPPVVVAARRDAQAVRVAYVPRHRRRTRLDRLLRRG